MRALTVEPGVRASARLEEVSEPPAEDGSVLVQTLAVGVCGTDREIVQGLYGAAPPGRRRLILGHESLGRVIEAPSGSELRSGDLVVGIVRRPDPEPCANCAVGEWDMCQNGRYTERGIQALDGYGSERFRISPEFAVRLQPGLERIGVLLEPASVVAKAWEQIEAIGSRALFRPHRVLVTGAGPIGLLTALLGVQRKLDVHVFDKADSGPKPDLVRDLGATYHAGDIRDAVRGADILIECTGVGEVVLEVMLAMRPGGIVCLTGVSSGGRELRVDMSSLNKTMVLDNGVVFGTVNANRHHYEAGASALASADPQWLERLITRRVPIDSWSEALEARAGDVKTVLQFPDGI